jgi:hypothetical protein
MGKEMSDEAVVSTGRRVSPAFRADVFKCRLRTHPPVTHLRKAFGGTAMPRDAMLGLLAGVVGVVLIAVVYHQKNATQAAGQSVSPNTAPVKANADTPTPANTPVSPR